MRTLRLFFPIILLFLIVPIDSDAQKNTQEASAAVEALKRSAAQGDLSAQVSLGAMYIQGTGVPQDYAEATKWLRKAAERGDRQAQGLLGSLYFDGLGVPKDYIEAYMWLTLSARAPADRKDPFFLKTAEMSDSLVRKMKSQEIEESERRAREWSPLPIPIPMKPAEGAMFSVRVDVVNVFVTVRDKKGNLIKDLSQEDFEIKEDGRIQNIQYFARESDLPITIGLIVDTTPSVTTMLDELRNASRIFFNKILHPARDRAFLIQYSNTVDLLQYVTSSRDSLNRSLNLLRSRSVGNPPETVLGVAVYYACKEIMKTQEGRKALILLGDGGHIGSYLMKAIETAQVADTMIYGIFICDPIFQGAGGTRYNRSQDKQNLGLLSSETGGTYFEVTGEETLAEIYGAIEEELRSQYNLGYMPDLKALDGYRKIKVSVKKKGLVVYARRGYFPKNK